MPTRNSPHETAKTGGEQGSGADNHVMQIGGHCAFPWSRAPGCARLLAVLDQHCNRCIDELYRSLEEGDRAEDRRTHRQVHGGDKGPRGPILVIDDDLDIRETICELLGIEIADAEADPGAGIRQNGAENVLIPLGELPQLLVDEDKTEAVLASP